MKLFVIIICLLLNFPFNKTLSTDNSKVDTQKTINNFKTLLATIKTASEFRITVDKHDNESYIKAIDLFERSTALIQTEKNLPVRYILNVPKAQYPPINRTPKFVSFNSYLLTFLGVNFNNFNQLAHVLRNMFEFDVNLDTVIIIHYDIVKPEIAAEPSYVGRHLVLVNRQAIFYLCHYCITEPNVKYSWERNITEIKYNHYGSIIVLKNVGRRGAKKLGKRVLKTRITPWFNMTAVFMLIEITKRLNTSTYFYSTFTHLPSMEFQAIASSRIRVSPGVHFGNGETVETSFISSSSAKSFDWKGMMGPIGLDILLFTILGVIVLSLTVFSLFKFGYKNKSMNMLQAFEVIVRPMLAQSINKLASNKLYFRITLIIWLFYCLMITETYRSELVRFLVTPAFDYGPKTFEELAFSDKTYFSSTSEFKETNNSCISKRSNTLNLFLLSYNYTMKESDKRIYYTLKNCNLSLTHTGHAYKRVTELNQIYIDEKRNLLALLDLHQQFSGNRDSGLLISGDFIKQNVYWFIYNDIYQPDILNLVRYLRDNGILNVYIKGFESVAMRLTKIMMLEAANLSVKPYNDGPQALRIFHVQALFMLTFVILIFSGLLFILEKQVCRKTNEVQIIT